MTDVLGNLFNLLLLVVLGFFVGVPMGIAYPFSLGFKILYAGLAVVCIVSLVVGVKFRQKIFGKIAVVAALLGWTVLGLIGLGTGT